MVSNDVTITRNESGINSSLCANTALVKKVSVLLVRAHCHPMGEGEEMEEKECVFHGSNVAAENIQLCMTSEIRTQYIYLRDTVAKMLLKTNN